MAYTTVFHWIRQHVQNWQVNWRIKPSFTSPSTSPTQDFSATVWCMSHMRMHNMFSAILKHGCGGAVRHSPSPKNPGSHLLTLVWDWADPVKWDQPKPQLSVNTLHWWASSQRTNHKITSSGVVFMTEKEGSLCARENLLRKAPSP